MNEFLQDSPGRRNIYPAFPFPKIREAIGLRAIPKGRKAEEPYYIDEALA